MYRYIFGTKVLSPHSWGTAIDLTVKESAYWKTVAKKHPNDWMDIKLPTYPQEIVHIFEKHGFIWGGRWSHFDTMHFEYRPELLLCAGKRYVR